MKVIEYGEGYPLRVKCSVCQSTLEIEPSDIIPHVETIGVIKNGLRQKTTRYIVCPVCGSTTIVQESVEDREIGISITTL